MWDAVLEAAGGGKVVTCGLAPAAFKDASVLEICGPCHEKDGLAMILLASAVVFAADLVARHSHLVHLKK